MATKLLPLLLFTTSTLATAVTITSEIPFSGHDCVRDCLYRPYNADTDLGDALECGPPYEEDCYCPTAAPAATIVSRHIDDCASEFCSRGDLTKDIESMKYYYAGYCIENGFTADLVQEWYDSVEVDETTSAGETTTVSTTVVTTTEEEETSTTEASTTEASITEETEEAATSTRTSVVTETATGRGLPDIDFEGNDPEDGASMSRAIVDVTSIVWVNSEGSQVASPPDDDEDSGLNVLALGIGLGVGVPLVLVAVGVGIWLCLRHRKRQRAQAPSPPSPAQQPSPAQHPSPGQQEVYPVIQTEKQELHGYHVTREIYGTEIHTLPNNSPSPPVAVAGRYEMPGESRPQEMDASRYR